MTAPVAIEGEGEDDSDGDGDAKKMQFWLPAEYDDLSKIPKPSNPDVRVVEVPPEAGVVHRYNGSFNPQRARGMAKSLVEQLGKEGVDIDESVEKEMMRDYQSWGYNPPFTISYFKRNEVWIPLTEGQVKELVNVVGDADVKN
uniref:SOUL heme-binding protein n=2 Tax=Odontella aurita TaxID=265563 RepID=A0A7S4MXW5_9STRA|mmetsp:Transcript_38850/g.116796  ORF Transcript_38850/g.116796 Transcript_38850/m.116796 type:complete len:143 (+) Transcript_38850:324-752(+)